MNKFFSLVALSLTISIGAAYAQSLAPNNAPPKPAGTPLDQANAAFLKAQADLVSAHDVGTKADAAIRQAEAVFQKAAADRASAQDTASKAKKALDDANRAMPHLEADFLKTQAALVSAHDIGSKADAAIRQADAAFQAAIGALNAAKQNKK